MLGRSSTSIMRTESILPAWQLGVARVKENEKMWQRLVARKVGTFAHVCERRRLQPR